MLYEPATAEELASSLATLLADRDRTRALGRRGWEAVRGGYTAAHMAAALEGAIEQSLGRGAQRPMAGRR